jgi:hypothetical protein
MTSPQLPAWIVIYPDPGHDRWQHSIGGPATGFACGHLDLPSSATADQVRQAAQAMLTELGRDLYHANLIITWHPPDTSQGIHGDIHQATKPA